MVYHIFIGVFQWFSKQFQQSNCINWFLRPNEDIAASENSLFYRIFLWIRSIGSKIFYALHLDKVFADSIFQMAFIWCILTVAVAPIMPTMVVFAGVLAGFASLKIAMLYDKNRVLQHSSINKYIYFYAVAYLFATFTSVTPKGSLFGGLLTIGFMLFSIVLINAIQNKKQLDIMMILLVCIGILVAFYGFYQYMFPDRFSGVWHDKEMFEDIRFRVYSTLGNPNVLGEYFLLIIPIAFAYFINCKNWVFKLFFLGSCGVMMLCLILTYSRGCYIGILVALGLFLVILDRRFIILGVIGLFFLPFVLPETIVNRFLSIGNMADSSTSYRVYIWLGTIAMLKDYWLCGVGPGTEAFNQVYPAYAFNSISAPHSHNLYLQIICDAGVIGILLFAGIIFQFYKETFGAFHRGKNKQNKVLLAASISAVSGFLVQSLFDYTFYNYRVMLLFWVVLAVGIICTKLPDLERSEGLD